ncbi:ATP-grasp ribosomal peptide maturase [Streptomyces sp. PRB2-1]|uniref:ATP-grasp ribosomal peptide maturase n=1 Tax=Actinacidiphila epipremni TaxID=2053013 RepID=A0ABX0ZX09_9ACTN|nr:ATP-grasp ribosomal peptide maturase [Actinacidiphila epipremni]NJP47721.1 ATP-grasp ribosomal peptide maturase [Actinacidiphila epipremni]
MRAGSVLVLTNDRDVTADVVLRLLHERQVPVVRCDPGIDLHMGAALSAHYGADGRHGTLRTPTREVALDDIRSVWVRRPSTYAGPPGLGGEDRRFAADQSSWGSGGILASLPGAHYVNHPWNNRAAEYKPAQLAAARRHSFRIPDTLITSDESEARRFIACRSGAALYKPVWNTPYKVDGEPRAVWVRPVSEHEVTPAVRACPHMFQARVEKAFDVRVTVVGERLFGTRIDSPDLDWRRRQDRMTCTPVDVPDAVTRSVFAYLREFRLVYGAFDFAVTPGGDWYFLECNPNGQWAWQPADITAEIARAIADRLEKGGNP